MSAQNASARPIEGIGHLEVRVQIMPIEESILWFGITFHTVVLRHLPRALDRRAGRGRVGSDRILAATAHHPKQERERVPAGEA